MSSHKRNCLNFMKFSEKRLRKMFFGLMAWHVMWPQKSQSQGSTALFDFQECTSNYFPYKSVTSFLKLFINSFSEIQVAEVDNCMMTSSFHHLQHSDGWKLRLCHRKPSWICTRRFSFSFSVLSCHDRQSSKPEGKNLCLSFVLRWSFAEIEPFPVKLKLSFCFEVKLYREGFYRRKT